MAWRRFGARCLGVAIAAALPSGVTGDPVPTGNLLENGSFEGSGGALPPGWELVSGSSAQVRGEHDEGARTGDGVLRFDTREREEPAPRVRVATSSAAPATPGVTYRLQYWVRVGETTEVERKSAEGRILFYDANDQFLARLYTAFGSTRGLPGRYWSLVQGEMQAPPGTHHLRVDLNAFAASTGSFKGTFELDDASVVALSRSELHVDPSAGTLAYHVVAPGVAPVPGFTAVPHDRVFDGTNEFGWSRDATRFTHRPAGYPTALQGYPVYRRSLHLPVPAGAYRVSLYMGVLWRTTIDQMNHRVRFAGPGGSVSVVDENRSFEALMDEEYFAYDEATLVLPSDLELGPRSVYRRILGRQFRRHDFDVDVEEGGLDIELDSGALAAVLLTPIEQRAAHDAAVAELALALEAEFTSTWAELLPTRASRGARVGGHVPDGSDYVLFQENWMRAVELDSRPDASEVGVRELRVVATPGEYEPVTFSIWPQRKLDQVQLLVDDLVAADGSTLPGSIVRTWFLQQKAANLGVPATAYRLEGHFLPDWGARDLYPNLVQRAWLSVKVPDDATPGIYRGTVRVVPAWAAASEIDFALEVLPFSLERPARLHTMAFAGDSTIVPYPATYPLVPGDVRNKNFYRAQSLEHLRALGLAAEFSPPDLNCPGDPADSVIDWDEDSTDGPRRHFMQMIVDSASSEHDWLWVDISHDQGCLIDAFDSRVSGGWTQSDVERYLSEIYRFVHEEYGFAKIYLHVSAEETAVIGNDTRRQAWIDYLDFIDRKRQELWPEYVTIHTANSETGQPIALEHVDIVALGMFHGVNQTDAAEQLARAAGKPYMFYGARGRFVPGYYLWRNGGMGTYHGFYSYYYGGAVNNDWDNGTLDVAGRRLGVKSPPGSGAHYSDTGRMIGSWFTEEIREGIDDDAYLHTLERWIERTRYVDLDDGAFSGASEARSALAAARSTADRIASRITASVDPRHLHDGLYRPIEPEAFDAWRGEVIEAIKVLQAIEGIFEATHARGQRRHGLRCLFPNEHARGRRSRRSCDRFASAGPGRL